MQWIEADTVSSQMAREFEQSFEVGEVPDAPVARRPDAIELDRQQPAAVEIAVESPRRRDDQRRLFGERGGVGQMQPVRADRQIRRPGDDAIMGLAVSDNLKTRNDFPAQRKCGSLAELGPRWPAGPNHHHPLEKPVWGPHRQGAEDDFQRGCVRYMPVTLTIDKFGLDPQVFGSGEKVHSARRLHATVRDVAKFSRYRKRIAVFNSKPSPAFPGNQCQPSGFLYMFGASPFPRSKRDVISMSMASP